MPPPRDPYDLSNEEWAIPQPLLSRSGRRGRPSKWPARRVADAAFYLLRSGCSWRMLPRESTHRSSRSTTIFAAGDLVGRLRRAHDCLREDLHEVEGRDRDPSAVVIDSLQVVKTTPVGDP